MKKKTTFAGKWYNVCQIDFSQYRIINYCC